MNSVHFNWISFWLSTFHSVFSCLLVRLSLCGERVWLSTKTQQIINIDLVFMCSYARRARKRSHVTLHISYGRTERPAFCLFQSSNRNTYAPHTPFGLCSIVFFVQRETIHLCNRQTLAHTLESPIQLLCWLISTHIHRNIQIYEIRNVIATTARGEIDWDLFHFAFPGRMFFIHVLQRCISTLPVYHIRWPYGHDGMADEMSWLAGRSLSRLEMLAFWVR